MINPEPWTAALDRVAWWHREAVCEHFHPVPNGGPKRVRHCLRRADEAAAESLALGATPADVAAARRRAVVDPELADPAALLALVSPP